MKPPRTCITLPPKTIWLPSINMGRAFPKTSAKAFEWYLAAAQHGDPVGQINLANLYYGGEGVARDYQAGRLLAAPLRRFRLARSAKQPRLFFLLWRWCATRLHRSGPPGATCRAEKSTRRADQPGYLYELGKGVPLDYVAAYSYYSRAFRWRPHWRGCARNAPCPYHDSQANRGGQCAYDRLKDRPPALSAAPEPPAQASLQPRNPVKASSFLDH